MLPTRSHAALTCAYDIVIGLPTLDETMTLARFSEAPKLKRSRPG